MGGDHWCGEEECEEGENEEGGSCEVPGDFVAIVECAYGRERCLEVSDEKSEKIINFFLLPFFDQIRCCTDILEHRTKNL